MKSPEQPVGNDMRKSPFNMVEVLLALGVIGIGAVSVLALFPYGFASTRDAVAESFAGDSADQFLHWFAAQARLSWVTYAGDATWLPDDKPGVPSPGNLESGSWGSSQSITPNLIYQRHSSDSGVTKVQFQRGSSPPLVDFSSVYRLWKDPVTIPQFSGSDYACDINSAVAINLEASWPAELPYSRRHKAVYRLEVFRPAP